MLIVLLSIAYALVAFPDSAPWPPLVPASFIGLFWLPWLVVTALWCGVCGANALLERTAATDKIVDKDKLACLERDALKEVTHEDCDRAV